MFKFCKSFFTFYCIFSIFGICWALSLIGEPCGISTDCEGPSATCLRSGVCDCGGGSVPMTNLTGCLLVIETLGDNCTEAAQCQGGPPGPFSDCVLPHPSLNQTQTVCNCTSEAISGNSMSEAQKCFKKATSIGDPCQSQLQCISNLGLSQCMEGKCACLSTARAAENGTRCVAAVDGLNSTCESNSQCSVPNSLCRATEGEIEKRCKCIPFTYIESRVNPNTCVKVVQAVSESCTESIQCTTGLGNFSDCEQNQCQCMNDTVYFNTHCYIKKKLGDACIFDDECIANIQGNVVCKGQDNNLKCSCVESFIQETETLCVYSADNGVSFNVISKLIILSCSLLLIML